MKVFKSSIPRGSLVAAWLPADYYSDAYAVEVDGGMGAGADAVWFTPDDIMVAFWTGSVAWVRALFRLRNFLVRFVGLKTGENSDAGALEKAIREGGSWGGGLMSIAAKNSHETVMMLSDKHLDAWLSIHIAGMEEGGDSSLPCGLPGMTGGDECGVRRKTVSAGASKTVSAGARRTVSAITVVRFHNRLGRVYLFAIRPFHALIVKTLLRGAVKTYSE
jgi:hypothetical protein